MAMQLHGSHKQLVGPGSKSTILTGTDSCRAHMLVVYPGGKQVKDAVWQLLYICCKRMRERQLP